MLIGAADATQPFIIGIDFMTQHKVSIEFRAGLLRVGHATTLPFCSVRVSMLVNYSDHFC